MRKLFIFLLTIGFLVPLVPVVADAACNPFFVVQGGTGICALSSGFVPFGNGTSPIATSSVFFWTNASSRLSFTNGSSTNQSIGTTLWLNALGTPAGTFIAVDPNGKVIATTTPSAGTGTVTNIATTFPILGGPITTTGTISWGGLSTTSNLVAGHVVYSSNINSISDVATTTQTFSGPFSLSATQGALVGGSNATITWTGLATTSNLTAGQLLFASGTTGAGVSGVATSTGGSASTVVVTDTAARISPTYASSTASSVTSDFEINSKHVRPEFRITVGGVATSTAGTGTTTIDMGTFPSSATLTDVYCNVNGVGTWDVQYTYGPSITKLAMVVASSTNYKVSFSSNNTPGAAATSTFAFGTAASSPVFTPQCTLEGTWNASI